MCKLQQKLYINYLNLTVHDLRFFYKWFFKNLGKIFEISIKSYNLINFYQEQGKFLLHIDWTDYLNNLYMKFISKGKLVLR